MMTGMIVLLYHCRLDTLCYQRYIVFQFISPSSTNVASRKNDSKGPRPFWKVSVQGYDDDLVLHF